MVGHIEVWNALEKLAAANNMSCSGLALHCGLNATTFNKSKRWMTNGKPRWVSTATLAKVLNALNLTVRDFAEYFPESGAVSTQDQD